MQSRFKLGIFLILFLLIIIYILSFLQLYNDKLPKPKINQPDIQQSQIPSQIDTPTPIIINNIKVNKVELFESQIVEKKEGKIPFISEIFVTQDEKNIINHLTINQLIEEKETYLVINSIDENPQNLDIYLFDSNISQTNIHFNITINKGLGYFSIGTNLAKGNYTIIILGNKISNNFRFQII